MKQYEKRAEHVSITDPLHGLDSFFRAGARRTNTLWGASEDQIRGTQWNSVLAVMETTKAAQARDQGVHHKLFETDDTWDQ